MHNADAAAVVRFIDDQVTLRFETFAKAVQFLAITVSDERRALAWIEARADPKSSEWTSEVPERGQPGASENIEGSLDVQHRRISIKRFVNFQNIERFQRLADGDIPQVERAAILGLLAEQRNAMFDELRRQCCEAGGELQIE